jgi:hypothetical protein
MMAGVCVEERDTLYDETRPAPQAWDITWPCAYQTEIYPIGKEKLYVG